MSATRISSGISAGTRIGVRGTEEIGRGMRAVFALESRVEADTGSVTNRGPLFYCQFPNSTVISCPGVTLTVPVTPALAPIVLGGVNAVNQQLLQAVTTVNSAGALFDRQAFAGLITPFGAFLLGRQYTPGYEVMNRFSAFADSTSGPDRPGVREPGDPLEQRHPVPRRACRLHVRSDVRLWRHRGQPQRAHHGAEQGRRLHGPQSDVPDADVLGRRRLQPQQHGDTRATCGVADRTGDHQRRRHLHARHGQVVRAVHAAQERQPRHHADRSAEPDPEHRRQPGGDRQHPRRRCTSTRSTSTACAACRARSTRRSITSA